MKQFLAILLLFISTIVFLQGPVSAAKVELTVEEKQYLMGLDRITMCVDPDWIPFEHLDEEGVFTGIAADLIELITTRLAIEIEIIPTRDWAESLAYSKAGDCMILPFLNQTPEREEWLIFTEPLFVDANVLITRQEHPFISDLADMVNKTIVFPVGTSMEENVRRDYPQLHILTTDTEIESLEMVLRQEADMTLRSLTISAYTIRKEGYFNLKIAGRVPEYTNHLRMGVLKNKPMLRDILNKAIATITPGEREEIVNRHVYIRVEELADYTLFWQMGSGLVIVILLLLIWNYRQRQHNTEIQKLNHVIKESEARYRSIISVTNTGAWEYRQSGRVWFSPEFFSMLGYHRKDFAENGPYSFLDIWRKLLHPDDEDEALIRFSDYMSKEFPGLYENTFRLRRKNGDFAWIWARGETLRDEQGEKTDLTLGTHIDISDLKEIENSLFIEKEQFRKTLLSVGDGVIATNNQGYVVIMNEASERFTGWTHEDALGLPLDSIYQIIDEKTRKPRPSLVEKVLTTRNVMEMDEDGLLLSKDDTEWFIEDRAAPILDKDGSITGVVLVFRDVTEKRKRQQEIEYLSYRDQLTGLYNRRFFEEETARLDTWRNMPLSILMIDVNGLKLINDAFGHAAGDALLVKTTEVLKEQCREDDIIARIGGDEFVVLLPITNKAQTEAIVERLISAASKEAVHGINLSFSCGQATKEDPLQMIDEIFISAENAMYKNKIAERSSVRHKSVRMILQTLYEQIPSEHLHSKQVSHWSTQIGQVLNLSETALKEISTASLLHDIGKMAINNELFTKEGPLNESEWNEIRRHSEVGHNILSAVNEYASMAKDILYHHERWNGSGYPHGLKEEAIPLFGRIIAVADAFDAMTSDRPYRIAMSHQEALLIIKEESGKSFDPTIVEAFLRLFVASI